MAYTRFEIEPGAFADILPEGAKLYKRPALPEIELKKGNVRITVSDVRLLHPSGVAALEETINQMANIQDLEEVRFDIPDDMDDDTLNIIIDIVSGYSFSAKYRNGDFEGGCLVTGSEVMRTSEGGGKLTFHAFREFARFVYQYAQDHRNVDLISIIFLFVERHRAEINAWMRDNICESEDMPNLKVRELVRHCGYTYREIAKQIGVTPEYLSRCMRYPLKPEMEKRILAAITNLQEVEK